MKKLLTILLLLLSSAAGQTVTAQENKVFVPSGILIDSGTSLYDSGSYRQAIEVLKKIDRNDTNYIKALYHIGLCYFDDSQYVKSLYYNQLGLSLHKDPDEDPDLLNQYGNSVDATGETVRAIGIFDSAILLYPGYSLLCMNKGTMLYKLKRYEEAEAVFKQTLLMDPYSYSAHFKLGMCALNEGKLIPAMLSFIGYLLIDPEGKYHNNCIKLLKQIANNTDEVQALANNPKAPPSEAFQALEQIVQSKIALDKNYKPLVQPDDPILRQIQVVFEKMEFDPADSDFYMQYYVPFFKASFDHGQFELFINQAFYSVDIPVFDAYRKRNKKELAAYVDTVSSYFSLIHKTRELYFTRRDTASWIWTFKQGKPDGHGRYLAKEDKYVGPWEFYYSKGNLRGKGMYNDHGKQEGTWTYYHTDGTLRAKINFTDGLQTGACTWYFPEGNLSSRTAYKDNLAEGESISYYLVGTPSVITHYAADKEEGIKVGLFGNGDTSYTETYSAGDLSGPVKTRYQSGKPESEYTLTNGKVEGLYTKYYENGRMQSQGSYSKGDQTGAWKTWYPDGQLKTEQNMVNGKLEGEGKEYNENGTVAYTYTYRRGKIEGEAHYYDDDGKQYAVFQYEKGLLQHAAYFDKAGKSVGQSQRERGQIELIQYYPDGAKKVDATFNSDDNITGTETFFYPSGKVQETDEYVNGNLQGESIAWYPDGTKKSETNYAGGKMNGLYRTYYANGQIREQGWEKDNDPCGAWIAYDELGAMTDSLFYSDGVVVGVQDAYHPNGKRSAETVFRQGWLWEVLQFDTTGRILTDLHFPAGTGKLLGTYSDGRTYSQGQYTRGKLDGPHRLYFPDGKKLEEEMYIRGQLDGDYRSYYHSGLPHIEGQYRYGNKTGTWKYYTWEGKLYYTEDYVEGKLNGKAIRYYRNGHIQYEISYKEDVQTGPFARYDPDGTMLYEVMLRNNLPLSYTYLDKNGNRLPAIPIVSEAAKMKTLFPNGNVSAEMEYKDGVLTGPVKLFYTNGQLMASYTMRNGLINDHYLMYYSNGLPKGDYFYLDDNLHGGYKEYNEKGILTESGFYYAGSPHGATRYFDDAGNLMETDAYYYGTLLSVK